VTGMRVDAVAERYVVQVEPGVTLKGLNTALVNGGDFDVTGWSAESLAALARYRRLGHGHVFPPDLTEAGACIGGVVANNGSGARSFRYGPARPHVMALRVVLSGGDLLVLRRGACQTSGRSFALESSTGTRYAGKVPDYRMPAVKNASGVYAADDMDLIDLFIGSEGTLGVISAIELALTPLPTVAWGLTAFLPSEAAALDWVERLRLDRQGMAAIEYFSAEALSLLRACRADNPAFGALPVIPLHWHTAVYVEFHGESESEVEQAMEVASTALAECGGRLDDTWLATSRQEIDVFKGIRHAVPEAVNLCIAERKKSIPKLTKLGTDLSVPDEGLRQVMAMYHQDLRAAGLEYVIFGHIGNNHVHVNILPKTLEEYDRGKAIYRDWARRVVSMGGSVSAEHGIGKLKTEMLDMMYGPDGVAQMRALKRVFDPRMLLNRGTLFPYVACPPEGTV